MPSGAVTAMATGLTPTCSGIVRGTPAACACPFTVIVAPPSDGTAVSSMLAVAAPASTTYAVVPGANAGLSVPAPTVRPRRSALVGADAARFAVSV